LVPVDGAILGGGGHFRRWGLEEVDHRLCALEVIPGPQSLPLSVFPVSHEMLLLPKCSA
jgi:hypothetical protein